MCIYKSDHVHVTLTLGGVPGPRVHNNNQKLTGASVVAFWVPHPEVSHGAGGEAHSDLTDVVALQEDEELGLTLDAAVVLRASVTAFGARWRPLGANCGNREKGTGMRNRCFFYSACAQTVCLHSDIWLLEQFPYPPTKPGILLVVDDFDLLHKNIQHRRINVWVQGEELKHRKSQAGCVWVQEKKILSCSKTENHALE